MESSVTESGYILFFREKIFLFQLLYKYINIGTYKYLYFDGRVLCIF